MERIVTMDYLAAANRELDYGTLTRAYMFGWRHMGYSWKEAISKARDLEIPDCLKPTGNSPVGSS